MYVHSNKTLRPVDYFMFFKGCWLPPVVSNIISKGDSAYLYFFLLHFMFFFSVVKIKVVSMTEINSKQLGQKKISYNNSELI